MFNLGGYAGKILYIDLTKKRSWCEELKPSVAKNFIGGTGFVAYLLWNLLSRNTDPLSPDNILIVSTGPATGTLSPSSGRFAVVSKSPLTYAWAESHAGGALGPHIKYAGYDFVIILGRAERPTVLSIDDSNVEFLKADDIWGLDTEATTDEVRARLGKDYHVMCIGPAGENLVRFASIIVDYHRAFGRTGMGAVMGSKRLKAIAVRGSKSIEVYDPDKYAEVLEEFLWRNTEGPWALPAKMSLWRYGTPNLVTVLNAIGRLPTKNHWTGYWEEAEKVSGEALLRYRLSKSSCFSCMIMCKQMTKVGNGKYGGTVTSGPEYETIFAFGSNLLIANIEAIIYFNRLCNLLGLDTISTGKVISFLFECYEKGFVSAHEVGFEPIWGSEEAVARLIEMIAFRKGLGDILAEGVARACKVIGSGVCCNYALHVKGLEVSGQDPRAQKSVGLTWAISVRGADHLRSLTTIDELGYREVAAERFGLDKVDCVCNRLTEECKALIVKDQEDFFAIVDSVIMCKYGTMWPPMYYFDFVAKLLKALTGVEEFGDTKYLKLVGERIVNLKRCFNLREGIGKETERLPKRFTEEPMPTGPAKGHVCNLDHMLIEYYSLRGWDYRTGLPYKATLKQLGLDFVIPALENIYGALPRRPENG